MHQREEHALARRFLCVIFIAVICFESAFGVADPVHSLVPAVKVEGILFDERKIG